MIGKTALMLSIAGLAASAAGAAVGPVLAPRASSPDVYAVGLDSANHTVSKNQTQPTVAYETLWVDETGATHVKHCRLEGLALQTYAPPAPPQWVGLLPEEVDHVSIGILPVGYVGEWHHAPGYQWVIVLSGAWSSETTDGSIIRQGPGSIKLDGDVTSHARGNDTRVGHVARTIGDEPCVQFIVSLKEGVDLDGRSKCDY